MPGKTYASRSGPSRNSTGENVVIVGWMYHGVTSGVRSVSVKLRRVQLPAPPATGQPWGTT